MNECIGCTRDRREQRRRRRRRRRITTTKWIKTRLERWQRGNGTQRSVCGCGKSSFRSCNRDSSRCSPCVATRVEAGWVYRIAQCARSTGSSHQRTANCCVEAGWVYRIAQCARSAGSSHQRTANSGGGRAGERARDGAQGKDGEHFDYAECDADADLDDLVQA